MKGDRHSRPAAAGKAIRQSILGLEAVRGRKCIVYNTATGFAKSITNQDCLLLRMALRQMGWTDRLDIVLHTDGGFQSAAHRVAVMVRDFSRNVTVLIPEKARSAGTLLSLSANAIRMLPGAELGPIDSHLVVGKSRVEREKENVSIEDIRGYVAASREWFGLKSEAARLRVFELLAEHFPAASLGALFRVDSYVRQIGADLLRYQLPRSSTARRRNIIERMTRAYSDHFHAFSLSDLRGLGLRASAAAHLEVAPIRTLHDACFEYIAQLADSRLNIECGGIVATATFFAYFQRARHQHQMSGWRVSAY